MGGDAGFAVFGTGGRWYFFAFFVYYDSVGVVAACAGEKWFETAIEGHEADDEGAGAAADEGVAVASRWDGEASGMLHWCESNGC